MTHNDVQVWLDRYIAAWSSYDPEAIGALFADDAEYRYQPWADPVVGREAIVADWLSDKDEAGSWTAHYDVWAFGSFKTLYYNHFQLRFDGHGKCVEFIEFFMELPERLRAGR